MRNVPIRKDFDARGAQSSLHLDIGLGVVLTGDQQAKNLELAVG